MTETACDSLKALQALEASVTHGTLGGLPVWKGIRANVVQPGVLGLIDQTRGDFEKLERQPSFDWDSLMAPLERLERRLMHVLGTVHHLLSVKYCDELQAAYDTVRPHYVAMLNQMNQSQAIYQKLLALRGSPSWGELDPVRQRIVNESMRRMERCGVHLKGPRSERYLEIESRLSKLSNQFQTNLVKEEQTTRIKIRDRGQLRGIPKPLLTLAASTAANDGEIEANEDYGPWHFVVNAVNFFAVTQHGEDRSLRERFYRAFKARGLSEDFDNRPVLDEILRLRQEQAVLVGFRNWAERSIDEKMAASVDSVWEFLREIESGARPLAERELAELQQFVEEYALGAGHTIDRLEPWDLAFYSEKLKQSRFKYDSEQLRNYLQLPKVLEGLFSLVNQLYEIQIEPLYDTDIPVWDNSVRFYRVTQAEKLLAGFYVDPYSRPGEKRGGAWMDTVVDRSRVNAPAGLPSSLPIALFVLNCRPPVGDRPALMSLEEVRTLFHEFGHAMQHMLTEIDEGGASGLNLVEWDAVELASQFNEYWMNHKPFLRGLSAHVDTGEPLDDATLEAIIASRNFMIGTATLRQLQLAKTDLYLHQWYAVGGGEEKRSPFAIERDIAEQTVIAPRLPNETQLPAFTHLFSGSYAAGYYSYKWAEVLAADAFAAFREIGLDDVQKLRGVAQRFRRTVLALGGSLPASEVYRQFRGRDASAEALLREQGMAA